MDTIVVAKSSDVRRNAFSTAMLPLSWAGSFTDSYSTTISATNRQSNFALHIKAIFALALAAESLECMVDAKLGFVVVGKLCTGSIKPALTLYK